MRKASVLVALLCGLSLLILAASVAAAGVPFADVQNVALTSTDTGRIPLALLGMTIFAAGVVLLRRPAAIPNP
jgi:hypothetical protein